MGGEHFLLASEIQIEREQKFVPSSLVPVAFAVVQTHFGGGIYPDSSSICDKIQIGAAVIIRRRSLQGVTDSSGKSKKPDCWSWIFKETSQSQMHVNAREHQM